MTYDPNFLRVGKISTGSHFGFHAALVTDVDASHSLDTSIQREPELDGPVLLDVRRLFSIDRS